MPVNWFWSLNKFQTRHREFQSRNAPILRKRDEGKRKEKNIPWQEVWKKSNLRYLVDDGRSSKLGEWASLKTCNWFYSHKLFTFANKGLGEFIWWERTSKNSWKWKLMVKFWMEIIFNSRQFWRRVKFFKVAEWSSHWSWISSMNFKIFLNKI